jgi:hypothetical protein
MFLQEFNYTIVHVKGKDSIFADGLSRLSLRPECQSTDDTTYHPNDG